LRWRAANAVIAKLKIGPGISMSGLFCGSGDPRRRGEFAAFD